MKSRLANEKIEKLFLIKNKKYQVTDKLDIIISPEFYWCRIFDIPVKNENKAIKLLPSLFEDILEKDISYSYEIKKMDDGRFIGFAYENDKIFNAIKDANINTSQVNKIYFAQIECVHFDKFKLDNSYFAFIKNILVKTPFKQEDSIDIDNYIDKINLSKKTINLKFYNSSKIETKSLLFISIFFLIIAITNIITYFNYSSSSKKIKEEIINIEDKNNLPKSLIKREYILKKYQRNISNEKELRDAIYFVIKNFSTDLLKIEYSQKTFEIQLKKQDESLIKQQIEKYYKVNSMSVRDDKLLVRFKI